MEIKISPKLKKNLLKLQGISASQKIFFVQQLGVMIKTGISLSVALKTLSEQTTSKRFKLILTDLQQEVEKGNLLSKGLEKYQKIFGELFINMIKAGEASGKLEEVLKQLYIQMKKDHDLISKIRGAMIYPSIVVTMMIVIGTLMVVYVIPNITGIFKEVDVELPLMTRLLIKLSNFLTEFGWLVAIVVVILIIAFIRFITWEKGKYKFHKILLKTPIVGTILKKINLARFSRTFSSLLKTDIPIVQTFTITSQVLNNRLYREALDIAKEKVKKGIGIQEALKAWPHLFPPVVLQMISVGEETGALDDVLEESAIFYEEEVHQTMTNLPFIIEPVLIVILGIGVGLIAVSVIMPMYTLSQAI